MWSRNPSQPEPSSQARGRSAGSSGSSAQAIRTQANAPGASADGVPGHAAVPEQIRGLGRDDVRRVGDDEVELLTLDRFEEAACSCLDVADAVERRVERCVGERPLVHVRRDHALGVRGEQNCLDPVAGAQVEGALALAAHGQVGESDGRTMHARHVVGVRLSGARMIRGDEQLVVRDEA